MNITFSYKLVASLVTVLGKTSYKMLLFDRKVTH